MKPRFSGSVSDNDKLMLGLFAVFSVLTARSLYLFYIDGLPWTLPLSGVCLTLGLFFNHLQVFVRRAAAKRVFALLFRVLICVALVISLIDLSYQTRR
ncbi:MAG: hypothetical protein C5B58_08865 [Acidobacteria bacterium]|nr:MAG: hypothetical protein C5B58_08865 [Acidobacteriota bacterium]